MLSIVRNFERMPGVHLTTFSLHVYKKHGLVTFLTSGGKRSQTHLFLGGMGRRGTALEQVPSTSYLGLPGTGSQSHGAKSTNASVFLAFQLNA